MHRLLSGLAVLVLALAPCAGSAQVPAPPAPQAPPGGYTGPLFPTGEPVVAEGPIAKKQAIMTVPVRFSFTGTLQAPVASTGWLDKRPPLPVGQPMFAMLYGTGSAGPPAAAVVWCALRRTERANGGFYWSTICLPGEPPRWVETLQLLPLRLIWTDSAPMVARAAVKSGPADFGVPISFSYRLRQIDSDDMDIDLYLSVDGYDSWIGQTNPRRQADGSALLPILGGVIRLVPIDKKSVRAEVIRPLSAQSPDLMLPIK